MSQEPRARFLPLMVLLLVVLGAGWGIRSRSQSRCDLPGDAVIAAYEWRSDQWRDVAEYGQSIAELGRRCVGRVYVDVTGAVGATPDQRDAWIVDLRTLAVMAGEMEVEVGVVAGDPWWFTTEGLADAKQVVELVADVERQALDADEPGLVGLHFDVEPWGLRAEWAADPAGLAIAWLEMIEQTQTHAERVELQTPCSWLISPWFDGSLPELPALYYDGLSDTALNHAWRLVAPEHALVVMAYRDGAVGPNGIIAIAESEMQVSGGDMSIAIETVAVEPATITFAGSSWPSVLAEVGDVADASGTSEIVVNDVAGLLLLDDDES